MNARRTEPTQSLLQGGPYTPAASTDIRVRFAQIRAQLQQPSSAKNVSTLKRKSK